MTGYSNTQINRLIQRKRATGRVHREKRTQPVFPRVHTADDIALLGAVDNAEQRRTGGEVQKTFQDMYTVYGDQKFERLSKISVAHIYNLRGTRQYETSTLTYTKTNPTSVSIGMRMKPRPLDALNLPV